MQVQSLLIHSPKICKWISFHFRQFDSIKLMEKCWCFSKLKFNQKRKWEMLAAHELWWRAHWSVVSCIPKTKQKKKLNYNLPPAAFAQRYCCNQSIAVSAPYAYSYWQRQRERQRWRLQRVRQLRSETKLDLVNLWPVFFFVAAVLFFLFLLLLLQHNKIAFRTLLPQVRHCLGNRVCNYCRYRSFICP